MESPLAKQPTHLTAVLQHLTIHVTLPEAQFLYFKGSTPIYMLMTSKSVSLAQVLY